MYKNKLLLGSKADDERVSNIIAEAVAVSFLGFFSGPFFATVRVPDSWTLGCMYLFSVTQGISVASRIFSAEIRSSAIGETRTLLCKFAKC